MRRAACLILTGCIFASVLLDPYTLHHDASDFVRPGPWWQRFLGAVDLLLLSAVLAFLWMRRVRLAAHFLAAETFVALVTVTILIHRDGIGRFRMGFGAWDYLWIYLLATGFRVVVLVIAARTPQPGHLAPTP